MRVIVANPNTSELVTEIVAEEARVWASPGTEIRTVTGAFGAPIITCRADNIIAAHSAMDVLSQHYVGCDAAIIAASLDPGLHAARELLPIPVVGMTEAACLTACMMGGCFGMVTFGHRAVPIYDELIKLYGLEDRYVGTASVEVKDMSTFGNPDAAQEDITAEILHLVEHKGAEAVVLAGAVFAGMSRKIHARIPVPLLDGIACAVRQAELLASIASPKPTKGSFQAPRRQKLVGVSDHLTRMYDKSDG